VTKDEGLTRSEGNEDLGKPAHLRDERRS
jgi:hypothetical protein